MKKLYSKPQIFIEDFAVSQSVASGCTSKAGFYMDKCGIKTYDPAFNRDVIIFSKGATGSICTANDGGGQDNNGTCYHIPIEGNKYFGS